MGFIIFRVVLVEEVVGRRLALAFAQQRYVHADEVSVAQRFFKRHVLDPVLLFRDAARVAQVHRFLNRLHVFVILVGRVVAQHVHVEAGALLDHGQADASGADDRDGFAGDFVSEKRQIRMPVSPLVFASQMLGAPHFAGQGAHHEKCEFGRGFGEDVGGVGEGNLVSVGVGAVDVVETDGDLGDDLQSVLARLETSASIGSRSVVIRPSMPDFTFSMIRLFGGASG